MEPLFKTSTKFTLKEYEKFNYAILKKRHVVPILIIVIFLLILAGIIGESLFLVMFGIIYPFILFLIQKINVKKVYNSNKLIQDTDVSYEFFEDHFEQKHESGNATIPYDKLNEVIETKTNFYLMIAKNQGYMLLKENMPEGLQEFLVNIKNKINQK